MADTPVPISSNQPPPSKLLFQYQAQVGPAQQPIPPYDSWVQWSEPKRSNISPTLAIALIASGLFAPVLNDETQIINKYESRWHQPWSEPVRAKPRAAFFDYQVSWGVLTPAAAPAAPIGWYVPLSQRPSEKITVSESAFSFLTIDESLGANFWYAPWPDFSKRKPNYAIFQPANIDSNFTPPVVTTNDTRWYLPLSEPVQVRRFSTAQQQTRAFSWFLPPASGLLGNWHRPFSEPVWARRFPASEQQFLSYTRFLPAPSSFLEGWYSAFGEPVRQKLGLAAQLQRTQTWSTFTPAPEVITIDKWYQTLAEPVRFRAMATAQQQPLAWTGNNPIVSIGYYGWLSEPVRLKRGLGAALQRETTAAPPQPNFFRLVSWLKPFDEPVWPKKGLKAWLQQFFTASSRPLPNAVTVVMSATETSKDIAQFSASVYNAPVRAYVSIEEVEP